MIVPKNTHSLDRTGGALLRKDRKAPSTIQASFAAECGSVLPIARIHRAEPHQFFSSPKQDLGCGRLLADESAYEGHRGGAIPANP